MNIEHLSISRSGLYQQCNYKYKLKYHLKVPSPKSYPWLYYGSIVHSVIEKYTENKGKIHINDIANSLLKEGKSLSFNYKRQLIDDLSTYKRLSDKIGFDGEMEVPFSIDLEPDKGKNLVGYIDRCLERNGIYYIFDWKTTKIGEWQKTEENIIGDIQLQVYSHVISKKMNVDASRIRACLYYLQGSKLVSASFSQKTLDEVPVKMLEIYNQIMEQDPNDALGNVGKHCGLCEYQDMCSFYKAGK